jgi:hypothetical protein
MDIAPIAIGARNAGKDPVHAVVKAVASHIVAGMAFGGRQTFTVSFPDELEFLSSSIMQTVLKKCQKSAILLITKNIPEACQILKQKRIRATALPCTRVIPTTSSQTCMTLHVDNKLTSTEHYDIVVFWRTGLRYKRHVSGDAVNATLIIFETPTLSHVKSRTGCIYTATNNIELYKALDFPTCEVFPIRHKQIDLSYWSTVIHTALVHFRDAGSSFEIECATWCLGVILTIARVVLGEAAFYRLVPTRALDDDCFRDQGLWGRVVQRSCGGLAAFQSQVQAFRDDEQRHIIFFTDLCGFKTDAVSDGLPNGRQFNWLVDQLVDILSKRSGPRPQRVMLPRSKVHADKIIDTAMHQRLIGLTFQRMPRQSMLSRVLNIGPDMIMGFLEQPVLIALHQLPSNYTGPVGFDKVPHQDAWQKHPGWRHGRGGCLSCYVTIWEGTLEEWTFKEFQSAVRRSLSL